MNYRANDRFIAVTSCAGAPSPVFSLQARACSLSHSQAMPSVASAHLQRKSSAIIAPLGEICGLGYCRVPGLALWLAASIVTDVAARDFCPVPAGSAASTQDGVQLEADTMEWRRGEAIRLRGGVRAQRGRRLLETEAASYDPASRRMELPGPFRYRDAWFELGGVGGYLDLAAESGRFSDVDYRLSGRPGRGAADELHYLRRRIELEGVSYTACPEGVDTWLLSSGRMTLDFEREQGNARDVTLRVLGLPVMYFPYLSFPIGNRRKSGFLYPSFGYSGNGGAHAGVPYYWNLAPNRDATLELHGYGRRGAMLAGEYRYLQSAGAGTLYAEWLPHDADDGGRMRGRLDVNLRRAFGSNWAAHLDYAHVTDRRYPADLGTRLSQTGVRLLDRRADLSWHAGAWDMQLRARDFQVLESDLASDREPYRLLPRWSLRYAPAVRSGALRPTLDTELTYFDRDAGVTGLRLDLLSRLAWPVGGRAGYFEPYAGLRYTGYRLDGARPASPSRLLPEFGWRAGLFLERTGRLGARRRYLHVLEPRLDYRFVPYRNQERLPVFDTVAADRSRAALFFSDRYVGADRVGDTHRLAAQVTARLIGLPSGRELASLILGQAYHFSSRRVRLPNETGPRPARLPLLEIVSLRPSRDLLLRQAWFWDPQSGTTDRLDLGLQYEPGPGRRLALFYRSHRADAGVEEMDVSLLWPVGERWSVAGRWRYALPASRLLEAFAGLEYRSCCWAVRLALRRFLAQAGRHVDGVFFQIELPGLSGTLRPHGSAFEKDVADYELRR